MTFPRVSFEFFPPQSPEAETRLSETVAALAPLAPSMVSVTYGAGGTTRTLTRDTAAEIRRASGLNVAAHLTCVGASREETLETALGFAEIGVTDIVALRGDPPKGEGSFTPHPDGFADAAELTRALADTGKFRLHVGAYPDPHPDARAAGDDVRWLKRKFEAGADDALTQFFFDADTFFRFRDACAAEGIDKPIIPGILPVENWSGVRKFAARCGATIPDGLDEYFTRAETEGRSTEASVAQATTLCERLLEGGVEQLHFYTLNKAPLSLAICEALGLTAAPRLHTAA